MAFKNQKRLVSALAVLLFAGAFNLLRAQEPGQELEDSLVRLVKASMVNLYQQGETHFRKTRDATFLHNNTYMLCDSAIWNVEKKIIKAAGNVKIIQSNTALLSDKMDYYIDEDLAKFRGSLVELTDRDGNTLRTSNLDYNTADSVGVFTQGGSMRSSDGQIIESYNGKYDSKTSVFEFRDRVEMFTDSVSIKTTNLVYNGKTNIATFPSRTDFWKDGNMMSAVRGWHDRSTSTFFFTGNVHAMTAEQEAWCDTIYIYRDTREVELFGRVQIQDSVRNVASLSDHLFYTDSIAKVTIDGNAAVALKTEGQGGQADTLYFGADTISYRTIKYADISEDVKANSITRRDEMFTDAVSQFRAAAAEKERQRVAEYNENNAQIVAGERMRKEAAAAAKKGAAVGAAAGGAGKAAGAAGTAGTAVAGGAKAGTGAAAAAGGGAKAGGAKTGAAAAGGGAKAGGTGAAAANSQGAKATGGQDAKAAAADKAAADSIAIAAADSAAVAAADSTAKAAADSLARIQLDSTKFGFVKAIRNIRLFKEDMQVRCDSLEYSDLDSIARFYVDPVVWNDGNRQYTSDSLFALVRGGRMDRASLLSNAFIITKETEEYFDQITGAEVVAFFNDSSSLDRFDALGDVDMLTFLKENDVFSTANKVTSRMMSASFINGQINRIHYFEAPKNNAYPIAQLPKTEFQRKGFNWRWEEKPRTRYDITDLGTKPSERAKYRIRRRPDYKYSKKYYPGYMEGVNTVIEKMDFEEYFPTPDTLSATITEAVPADTAAGQGLSAAPDSLAAPADSLAAPTDSLVSPADSLAAPTDSLVSPADSLAAPADTLAAPSDSLAAPADSIAVSDSLAVSSDSLGRIGGFLAVWKAERQRRQEAYQERQNARRAATEQKWAVLDSLEALKKAEADMKAAERDSIKTERARQHILRQQMQDRRTYQKYLERYRRRYLRDFQDRPSKRKDRKVREVPSDTRKQSPIYRNAA